MKKFAYIFCIAILGVACSKEAVSEIEFVKTIDVPENMVKISITVPREPETRATMSGKQLSFAAEDEIAVIGTLNAETSIQKLVVESISETAITFSAAIDPAMEIGDYAYYPVSIANKDNPTVINWPSSFDGTNVQMPMMAKIDVSNNQAVFRHLGAMLKVNLTNAPAEVTTLEFKTTDPFVGSYDVSFKSDNTISSVTAHSVSGNTETLSVKLSSATTYYVPIPAGTYAQFQLGMKEGDYYHKQRTSALTAPIEPVIGNMVNLGDFDYDVDQIEEWYLASDLTNWDAGYKYNRFIKIADNTYYLNSYNRKDNPWWSLYDQNKDKWRTDGENGANYWEGDLSKIDGTFNRTGSDDRTFWIRLDYNSGSNTWHYSSGNWSNNSDREWSTGYVKLNITGLGTYNLSRASSSYSSKNYSWMYENLVIPSNSKYSFKFILNWNGASGNDVESGVSGTLDLTDACTYGKFVWAGANAMTAQLTPGKYNVYLDLADLNFMFVKQPKSN